MKKNFLFIIFILFNFSLAYGDLIKPNIEIEPKKVVKIQLSALMKNNSPYKDWGIIQTWEFAHPNNQKMTGPIEKFKNMIKTDSYSMLLSHSDHEIVEVYKSKDVATFEVTILDNKKKYYKFKWQVEKYNIEGTLKDCWLTTAVSQPMPLGSSI
ncbi:DUF4864 domain-containing protein [Candidatus Pelagibacter sp.]|nr:DUF4864 domain-containing protein [Candidatus Pelagibacter sp.]